VEVRPTRSGDWAELRRTRLTALADSPDAYAATLAGESALADEVWQQRAAPSEHRANFAAVESRVWLGMCAILGDEDQDSAQLVALWVDPAHRGRGVGAALVAAVTAWCRDRGIGRLRLWVNEVNESAIRLYERCEFQRTGERQPLPNHPGQMEIAMAAAPLPPHPG